MMKNKHELYHRVCEKAAEYQLSFLKPDGSYIWEGYPADAFHKQAYAWGITNHIAAAQRLLNWIKKEKLNPDGSLKDYNGDIYKHTWLFQGAHRLGRFDVSYPVMSFLKSCQYECGGFPHFAGDKLVRALSTAWTGVSALYYGDMEMAEKISGCCISMLEQQPTEDRFYFQMTKDGKLYTDGEFIDTKKQKQCYWEVGFALILMCRMHQATGEKSYLEYARRLFEFKLRCAKDSFAYWGSGKSALGAAIYYALTGDRRGKDAALTFCEFIKNTQRPEGGFQYEDEPDELIIYVDHAACFTVWGLESLTTIESVDGGI